MTNLPFFYAAGLLPDAKQVLLDEDNSRHVVSVLRMARGSQLHLTDGRGLLLTAVIEDPDKKKCRLSVLSAVQTDPPQTKTAIGISLLKNPVRFEWFLEKATEIGITEVFPLLCTRTEKQHFRMDRMRNVTVSAMLQSKQCWLPVLHEPAKFPSVLEQRQWQQLFIAHCSETERTLLDRASVRPMESQLMLIGPEGDFTHEEIVTAQSAGFVAVSLGATRLRTETAGVVAATLLRHLA